MKTVNSISLIFVLTFFQLAGAATINGLVKNQGETLNFELSGQKNWDYDLKRVKDKNQTKVQLLVNSITEDSISKIKNIENPYVQSISVQKHASDGKWMVEFVLKNENVDTFDYLTDQPSKLIVDFYVNDKAQDDLIDKPDQEKATKAKAATIPKAIAKPVAKKLPAKKSLASEFDETPDMIDRKPAQADYLAVDQAGGIETSALLKARLNDGADAFLERFVIKDIEINEKSILKSDNNYYLKFPMLETSFSFWDKMKATPPQYEFQSAKTEENKQMRLIKTLFDKKRFNVFGKTVDWFENKYPESEYLESLAFMKSDALMEQYKQNKTEKAYDEAKQSYVQAVQKYPKSALAERTSLMLGMLDIEHSDYMSAIRRFNAHAENPNFKDRLSTDYARLGQAYSFSKIKRLEEAVQILNKLEKETKNPQVQAEAAYRRGDFYFEDKKFAEAIANYKTALSKYPTSEALFPNASFNQMESNFWTKKYKEAHQAGLDFVAKFHTHPHAPYAMTRVGELLDILGAEPTKAVGAYLETFFRYGDNPKTIVARLHLLSTRMKSMKDEELKQTNAKMDELAKKSDLPNIDQFKAVMVADGYSKRGDQQKAIDILADFFQKNPTRPDSKQVTRRIMNNIYDQLRSFSDAGKFKDVLKTYQKYSDTWLNHNDRIDTDFYLGLAYDSAGDYEVALDKYLKVQKSLTAIKGTEKEKWISVTENLPSDDNLNLHIADAYFQLKNFQQSYQQLEKIKAPHLLSEPDQIKRIQMASDLYEQKGDSDTAMRYLSELVRVWNGKPELAIGAILRLAEMQNKRGATADAQKSLEKIMDIAEANPKVNSRDVIKAANLSAGLYTKADKLDDAAKKYNFILSKYDADLNLSEERYKLGDIYFKKGEVKKAESTWSQFKGEGSQFWAKLSSDKLRNSQWKDDYKKYLKRIPAMSQIEEQK